MPRTFVSLLLAVPIAATASVAFGREVPSEAVTTPVEHPAVVTRHRGTFNGRTVRYTATVEGMVATSAGSSSSARIVSFAYTLDGAPRTRPVMFLFNGGPIVPSPYVHIGGLGPKRIAFPDDVRADPASFRLVDNVYSPLDQMDLVFVDPASTGFSRVMPGTKPQDYYSVQADAAQFAAFIRTWLKAKDRVGAPVYLFGESYGTNRAATIAGLLSDGPDALSLAGIFLFGQAVNILEYAQRPNNVVSYVASLPTLAAIGFYHDRVVKRGRTRDAFLADARLFARTEYLTALYQGDALSSAELERIASRLEEYTGIPADWYAANRLRMTKERYRLALLEDRKMVLGRNDARYAAPLSDRGGAADPSDVLGDAIDRIFLQYMRDDLKVSWRDPYVAAVPLKGLGDWAYADGIAKAMSRNPTLRLVIGNGLYDTQTTMGAAELLSSQYGWDRKRTTLKFYDGGHMGYSVAATAKAIGEDIRAMAR